VRAWTGRVARLCQQLAAGSSSSHSAASGIRPVNASHISSATRSSWVNAASSRGVEIASQSLSSARAAGARTGGVMMTRFMR